MNDSCDCSKCPHHCGDDEEVVLPTDENDTTAPTRPDTSTEDSDDKEAETSAEKTTDAETIAEEKVEKLKKAIQALGFSLEDTEKGTKITM